MAICCIGDMKKDRYEWLKNNIKQIGEKFWKLTEIVGYKKRDVAIVLVCAVLVIVAIVSIVKIIQIRNVEVKQAQEVLRMQWYWGRRFSTL